MLASLKLHIVVLITDLHLNLKTGTHCVWAPSRKKCSGCRAVHGIYLCRHRDYKDSEVPLCLKVMLQMHPLMQETPEP